ncbi:MAG: CotH kinase family protein [Ruminococcus sp.]|nr:CotH kinase family protein [Ruminococcus sp.]
MKKILSLLLALIMVLSLCTAAVVSSAATSSVAPTVATAPGLYAHAYSKGEADTEAWVKWYEKDDTLYFFMPAATDAKSIEIYNAYEDDAVFNGVTIKSKTSEIVNYEEGKEYTVKADGKDNNVIIMRSSAEGAMFVNNTADFDGMNLWDYLTDDKSNDAKATGAILDDKGNIDTTPIKKIKGRGNTSWDADKKGFNVTYDEAVCFGTMQKCKKFSLISNFQDASLNRNRLLYDLADEVGVPYASDSRFVEFYVNGEYLGNYQVCEKVDVGKNTLMPDIDDEDYLNYVDGTQTNFEFVCEIDAGPDEDDFTVKAGNGNNLTMKAPELEKGDVNYSKVQKFIKSKYDLMYKRLTENHELVDAYIDIESLAQVYIINELGKNWDSGAGSFFFVYKPDEDGKYKFYASPVWDYDNSLGNAQGVEGDLDRLGIDDYEEPTGWFSKYKNGYRGPNFLKEAVAKCDALNEMIPKVWFEQFVPAIENRLNGTGLTDTELYSSDVYYNYLDKSADMNFIRWDIIQEPQWIADHTMLKQCHATYEYNRYGQIVGVNYSQDSNYTFYDEYVFDAEYQYMIDWTNSRVAWMSSQYIKDYTPETPVSDLRGDADLDGVVSVMDATEIQLDLADLIEMSDLALTLSDVDDDSQVSVMDATEIQLFIAQKIEEL